MQRRKFLVSLGVLTAGCGVERGVFSPEDSPVKMQATSPRALLSYFASAYSLRDRAALEGLVTAGFVVTDATHDYTIGLGELIDRAEAAPGILTYEVLDLDEQNGRIRARAALQRDEFSVTVLRDVELSFVSSDDGLVVSRVHGMAWGA